MPSTKSGRRVQGVPRLLGSPSSECRLQAALTLRLIFFFRPYMNLFDIEIQVAMDEDGNIINMLIAMGEESKTFDRDRVLQLATEGDVLCSLLVNRITKLKLEGKLS